VSFTDYDLVTRTRKVVKLSIYSIGYKPWGGYHANRNGNYNCISSCDNSCIGYYFKRR